MQLPSGEVMKLVDIGPLIGAGEVKDSRAGSTPAFSAQKLFRRVPYDD